MIGFDIDPMAFINPFTTASEIQRFVKEKEAGEAAVRDLEVSVSADRAAVSAIYQASIASAAGDPKADGLAKAAQGAIDAANQAGKKVPKAKRLDALQTSPPKDDKSGLRARATQHVLQAVSSGQPIPDFIPPNSSESTPATTQPALDRVTLLRQRADAARAEHDRVKSFYTKVHGASPMQHSGYEIIGQRQTILGEGAGWMDMLPGLFSAAGQGVSSLVEKKKADDALEKTTKDSEAALYAATSADQRAREALSKALFSEDLKSPSASADRLAADMSLSAQDEAGRGLSPENCKKRSDAAKKALEKATNEWQAASAGKDANKTKAKELGVRAAQQVYAKTQNALMVQASQFPGGLAQQQAYLRQMQANQGSWFTRPVLGPVPGIGVLAGVGVIAGVVYAAVRKAS